MPIDSIKTNFTAGELSPRLKARIDIDRWNNGAEELENVIPVVHGGVRSAPGWRYVATGAETDSAKKTRLIPFVFSDTQSYVLELSGEQMRFYTRAHEQILDEDDNPYELSTPWAYSQIFGIRYLQRGDSMILLFPTTYPRILRRHADDYWTLTEIDFVTEPMDELGHRFTSSMTISDPSVGTGRTFTSAASVFLISDVGRFISFAGGRAEITGYTSATVVEATIIDAFRDDTIPFDLGAGITERWVLEGSPMAACSPSATGPVGTTISLVLSGNTDTEDAKTITGLYWDDVLGESPFIVVEVVDHGYAVGDTVIIDGCTPSEYNGTYVIYSVVGNEFGCLVSYPNPGTATGLGTVERTTSVAVMSGWRTADVGKHVKINGGLAKITSRISGAQALATVKQVLSSDVTAEPGSWKILDKVWSAYEFDGYPMCGALYQQRLVLASTRSYPITLWGSRIGVAFDFTPGVNDDDGFALTIDAEDFSSIQHLAKVGKQLAVLGRTCETVIYGGTEKALTPTNFQIDEASRFGASYAKPVRIGNELFYVQQFAKKVRAMGYKFDTDAYGSPDISVLGEHITSPGITDMAFAAEPESVLWAVRDDGVLATCTIDRDQNVIAWARQTTVGEVESVCVIPGADGPEVWRAVRRTIDGASVCHIEVSDWDLNTHAAVTGTSEDGTETWSGLDHLEGEEVAILADGVVMERQAVSDGQITLDRVAYEVEIGLPRRCRIKTLPPELPTQSGTSAGKQQRISKATLRVLESYAFVINDQYVDFRMMDTALLDQPLPEYTGDYGIETLGWERPVSIEVETDLPLPMHLLGIVYEFQSG